jgi:transcriptional regulator with XRE-family HTH domain
MSSRAQSTPADALPLGAWLRQLRKARHLTIRVVAASADMDTAHLSKIELGQRLPTEAQAKALADFFNLPIKELAAKRIVEKFWRDNKTTPETQRAAAIITTSLNKLPR